MDIPLVRIEKEEIAPFSLEEPGAWWSCQVGEGPRVTLLLLAHSITRSTSLDRIGRVKTRTPTLQRPKKAALSRIIVSFPQMYHGTTQYKLYE